MARDSGMTATALDSAIFRDIFSTERDAPGFLG